MARNLYELSFLTLKGSYSHFTSLRTNSLLLFFCLCTSAQFTAVARRTWRGMTKRRRLVFRNPCVRPSAASSGRTIKILLPLPIPQPIPPRANIDPPEVQRIAPSNVCKFTLNDLPANVPKYKSMDVKQAYWANVRIGQGATATVWAGIIKGIPVAIKELNKEITPESFESEVKILARLNHMNIVGIKGVCLDEDDKFIFYERMEDSLDRRLFSSGDPASGASGDLLLTWKERLLVALDITNALKYLHGGFDDEMGHRAHIANFGCAVIVAKNDLPATNIPIAGTFGYMDPSYFTSAELTPASDIFAFGGIQLDMITGKNSFPKIVIGEEVTDESFASIKDPELQDVSAEDLRKLLLMARSCRDIDSKRRPTASQLEVDLEEILNNLS